jgi:ABC-type nitrate/sulfonate/bicarbonate transport system permease component
MESRTKHTWYAAVGWANLVALMVVWEVAGRVGWLSPLAIPLPSDTSTELGHQLASLPFYATWGATLRVWAVSMCLGLFGGLFCGFLAGSSRFIYAALLPTLSYLRAIPPIALFPIALVAIGPGGVAIGTVVTLCTALYVFPATAEAARTVADRFKDLGAILGLRRFAFLRTIVMPGTGVQVLIGSRVAATLALVVCIAGEMVIGGQSGVGAAILIYSEQYLLEKAYAFILSTGVMGLVVDNVFKMIIDPVE